MAVRNIVKIDEEKCNGCGQCVDACAEGAIEIIDGKAKLISEIYCDGLGECLGHCPEDAITIEQRDANEFDEEVTKVHVEEQKSSQKKMECGCPGTMAKNLCVDSAPCESDQQSVRSQLSHWPVQLKLVSPQAPYFANCDLLFVADCVPFAMGDFHSKFLKGHSIAIGCPKLDDAQFYVDKFADLLKTANVKSLKVIHMEVPCCFGMTQIVRQAIATADLKMSFEDITIGLEGDIKKTETIEPSS